jgi:hypothetical protein
MRGDVPVRDPTRAALKDDEDGEDPETDGVKQSQAMIACEWFRTHMVPRWEGDPSAGAVAGDSVPPCAVIA